MKIPEQVQSITVFYDGHCGMCCTFHEWVNRQERSVKIHFVAYQSPEAEIRFPGIGRLEPDREMIVRDEADGTIFRGAEAWVLCLASLTEFRPWAERLSSPVLLPVAKKTCHHLALNRHKLSKIFFRAKDEAVAAELHRMPPRPAACVRA